MFALNPPSRRFAVPPERWSAAHTAAWLAERPLIESRLQFAPYRRGKPSGLRAELTSFLATDESWLYLRAQLSRACLLVIDVALWHGGRLTEELLVEEFGSGALRDPFVLAAIEEAIASGTASRNDQGEFVLWPEVSHVAPTPGVSLAEHIDDVSVERLREIVKTLGLHATATRKAELVAQVLAFYADHDQMTRLVGRLPAPAVELFNRLIGSVEPIRRSEIGFWRTPYSATYLSDRDRAHPATILWQHGLIGSSDYDYDALWAWREVVRTLRPFLRAPLPALPLIIASPLAVDITTVPSAPALLDRLIDMIAAEPVDGTQDDALGVQAVKKLAKAVGMSPEFAATALFVAGELQLIGRTEQARGTGRRIKWVRVWTVNESNVQAFRTLSPTQRWWLMVTAWIASPLLPEREGIMRRVPPPAADFERTGLRRFLLRRLSSMEAGTGIDEDALIAELIEKMPIVAEPDIGAGLVSALRALGLIPPEGPVGLTSAGRAYLADDPDQLVAGDQTFILQPDLTLIVSPNADPQLLADIGRFAVVESNAGAIVARLDAGRIAQSLDGGASADSVLEFLAERSSTGMPDAVRQMVLDVTERHGSLAVVDASVVGSLVTSEDAVVLTRACEVRSAKLTPLNLYVATSPLSAVKVAEVLRARGIAGALVAASAAPPPRPAPAGAKAPAVASSIAVTRLPVTIAELTSALSK